MPRDLFGDVSDPSVRVGSRTSYTVPLSLAAHAVVLLVIVVIPLMATGALPTPRIDTIYVPVDPGPLPVPPPVRAAIPEQAPRVSPNAPPIVTPDAITPEPLVADVVEPGVEGAPLIPGSGVVEGSIALVEPPPAPTPQASAPVPVGGRIRAPEKVRDVAPIYPVIAQTARVEGVVIIEAIIGVDGRVQNARVLRSLPLLDEAALGAVRQWIYRPTTLNGIAVPVIMTVTVRFQLR